MKDIYYLANPLKDFGDLFFFSAFPYNPYTCATLHVLKETIDEVPYIKPWSLFSKVVAEDKPTSGITDTDQSEKAVREYYNMHGVRLDHPSAGFNIVVYDDGSCRKIFVPGN